MRLKQSTAVTIIIGPFIDDTDGKTAETAMGLVQADVRVSKNWGSFAQKGETTSPAHLENGYYSCALNTTDTGTLGPLKVAVHKSGALPVWHDFEVVTANQYDTAFSTDIFDVSVTQWNGTNVTTPDVAGSPKVTLTSGTGAGQISLTSGTVTTGTISSSAINAAAFATGAITATAIASDAITAAKLAADVADEIWDEVMEGSLTARQSMMAQFAATAGKSAGGGTATITFRNYADTLNRISATVDTNGNRTAVTYNFA